MNHLKNNHICFLIGNLSHGGGTERMTVSLANELMKLDYKISIISIAPTKKTFFKINTNINLYSILDQNSNFFFNYFKIYNFIRTVNKSEPIDVLINVDVILALFSIPLKISNKSLKIISWEHFNYKTNLGIKRRDWARHLSKRYADLIVTLTEQDRSFYLENTNCSANIVSIANFLEQEPHQQAELSNKKVLAIGRFSYQKGFDILIELWKLIKQDDIAADWTLQIVGDGEMKSSILDLSESLKVNDSVDILDATQNVSDYYLNSSIYVMTSRYEGLPMVLIEAQSFGLPIVSFNCLTGPQDIIDNNVSGFLIEENNLDDMKDSVIKLMKDYDLRIAMGKSAYISSKKFSKNNIIKKWDNCLKKLNC